MQGYSDIQFQKRTTIITYVTCWKQWIALCSIALQARLSLLAAQLIQVRGCPRAHAT